MKTRLLCLCLLAGLLISGCAQMTNMTSFTNDSGIPPLTEPDLDDE